MRSIGAKEWEENKTFETFSHTFVWLHWSLVKRPLNWTSPHIQEPFFYNVCSGNFTHPLLTMLLKGPIYPCQQKRYWQVGWGICCTKQLCNIIIGLIQSQPPVWMGINGHSVCGPKLKQQIQQWRNWKFILFIPNPFFLSPFITVVSGVPVNFTTISIWIWIMQCIF